MSPRGRRTFTVSRGRAFVGNMLGNTLSDYTKEELEEMVQGMEDFYAEEDATAEEASNTEAQDIHSSED